MQVLARLGNEKRREEEDAAMAKTEEHLGWLEQKEGDDKKKKYLEEYESYLKSDVYNKNNKAIRGRPGQISQPIRITNYKAVNKSSSKLAKASPKNAPTPKGKESRTKVQSTSLK